MVFFKNKDPRERAEHVVAHLKHDYTLVGRRHVRVWQVWLAIGLVAGVIAGILFVASRTERLREERNSSFGVLLKFGSNRVADEFL